MDELQQAKQTLDQARQKLAGLDAKLAQTPDDAGIKAEQEQAQREVSLAEREVNLLERVRQSDEDRDRLRSTVTEQEQAITRLQTTQSTVARRQQDIQGKDKWSGELARIQELAKTDPGGAAAELARIQGEMRQDMTEEAVNAALVATNSYINSRQSIDRVRTDNPHLAPYEELIKSRIAYLMNIGKKSLEEAKTTAVKEAQALFDSGKASVKPEPPPPPPPGARGQDGGVNNPPLGKQPEKALSPAEEIAQEREARNNKGLLPARK